MPFQLTSFQLTMNSFEPCLFFETSAPARAGHYLVFPTIWFFKGSCGFLEGVIQGLFRNSFRMGFWVPFSVFSGFLQGFI